MGVENNAGKESLQAGMSILSAGNDVVAETMMQNGQTPQADILQVRHGALGELETNVPAAGPSVGTICFPRQVIDDV